MSESEGPFHAGELAVQARAGVAADAQRVGRSIGSTLSERAVEFVESQRLAVLAGFDAAGAIWASPLIGAPGFVRAIGDDALELAAALPSGDPLADALTPGARVGALLIDLENRRRLRANGIVEAHLPNGIVLGLREVFWNCPKYIQRREIADATARRAADPSADASRGDGLGARERAWLASADTCFVASAHPERGPDASHRGGAPGFVRVIAGDTLELPDYTGNAMFQTLGNLVVDARIGLAFPDFVTGRVLQLSGRARLVWDESRRAPFPGAERVVEVHVQHWCERALPGGAGWRLVEASPQNPPPPVPAR